MEKRLLEIRKNIFLAAFYGKSNGAHIAPSYSSVEILYSLYMNGVVNVDPQNPKWVERDRVILSKGHASLALYEMLAERGFFSRDTLRTFCFPNSILGGEPNMVEIPGVDATTGSLGHGLPYAIGIAMGLKMNGSKAKVYVVVGDGECQEGSIWEAVMAAYRQKLDNLVVVIDNNGLQKMDLVSNTMSINDWQEKWSAFGWQVDIVDGHNVDELTKALKRENLEKLPRVIIANTIKGKGVSIIENSVEWHFRMPNKRQLKVFMEELGIAEEELKNAESVY
ncbi:MAG: transketolase [Agathobacter sp.]|nr:transketolase [Agathobacter sp.]